MGEDTVDGWGDHPREYGENHENDTCKAQTQGSSPRIRGESNPRAAKAVAIGIIPANTGRI